MDDIILDLATVKEGMSFSNVNSFLSSFTTKAYGEGKVYGSGSLTCQGVNLTIKVWEKALIDKILKGVYVGNVVSFTGTTKTYQGTLELTVTDMRLNPNISKVDFLPTTDGLQQLQEEFFTFINTKIAQPYVKTLLAVFNGENVLQLFCKEYAGNKMHDAKIGGLLNHTLKMLRLAETIVKNDVRLEAYKDILYAGVILHDIGKVQEMNLGIYTANSFPSHRMFGIEMLCRHKAEIVAEIGETNYYHLQCIIQGHHGQWGEPPKTVWAYIVHLIDMLESATTGVLDKIERGEVTEEYGSKKVYMNDGRLTF